MGTQLALHSIPGGSGSGRVEMFCRCIACLGMHLSVCLFHFCCFEYVANKHGIIGGGFRSSGSTLPLAVNDGRVGRCRCSDEEPFSAPRSHSTVLFVTVPNTLLLLLLLHGGNMSCLPQVVRRLLLLYQLVFR